MKKISLILFLCIIAFSILRAEDKSVIRLIPVYEKTFQDTIVDVIFDTATVSIKEAKEMGWKDDAFNEEEKRIGKGEIFYTKVVILKKGKRKLLNFFNSKGRLKKSFKTGYYAELVISQNDKYIGITTPGENESKFQMVDIYGNIIWEITGLGTGPYTPSPDGRLTIGTPSIEMETVPIEIWNKNGLMKEIENPYGGWSGEFSNDGKYLAIAIRQSFLGKGLANGYLALFDSGMNKIWQKNDVEFVRSIEFSNTNKYIIAVCGSDTIHNLSIFTFEGEKVLEIPLPDPIGTLHYTFSADEKQVIMISDWGYVWYIDIPTKKVIWKFRKKKGGFETIQRTQNMGKILIGTYSNKIYLLDKNGKLILEKSLSQIKFHECSTVKIASRGNKFIMTEKGNRIKSFCIK